MFFSFVPGSQQHINSLDWLAFSPSLESFFLKRRIDRCKIFVQVFLDDQIKVRSTLELHR